MYKLGKDCDDDCEIAILGTLALSKPILDKLRVAEIIDRLAPANPQQEYSHGQVLTALLAARLDAPRALMNVAEWAANTHAEIMLGIPADKLNDDRLARSLDVLFDIRHSLTAAVVAEAMRWTGILPDRIHYDPTHITFYGRYDDSKPRSKSATCRSDSKLPAAHLTRGYNGDVCIQLGIAAYVDDIGAMPIAVHCYDGNRNGHSGIHDQMELLRKHHKPLSDNALIISDRGTFSAEHLRALKKHDQAALCAAPWNDYRRLFDEQRTRLNWQKASFLSQEQQRRRDSNSSLPQDDYRLAVVKHTIAADKPELAVPVRVIFVHSSAGEREEKERREENIVKIREGLKELAAKLTRGHPQSTSASIQKQAVRLLGKRDAGKFFNWHLTPLNEAELAALPAPRKGFTRPTHRLEWTFDANAAQSANIYDGVSVLVTTAPITWNADQLFTQYKRQCYVERMHHQLKTPLGVSPVFLKTAHRVEALIHLLTLALIAQQAAERVYRQRSSTASTISQTSKRDRTTADQLWSAFKTSSALLRHEQDDIIVHPASLNYRATEILNRLVLQSPRASIAMRTG